MSKLNQTGTATLYNVRCRCSCRSVWPSLIYSQLKCCFSGEQVVRSLDHQIHQQRASDRQLQQHPMFTVTALEKPNIRLPFRDHMPEAKILERSQNQDNLVTIVFPDPESCSKVIITLQYAKIKYKLHKYLFDEHMIQKFLS